MIWLESLSGLFSEATVFALGVFGILSVVIIFDYLWQKKRENKFAPRFLQAKIGGENGVHRLIHMSLSRTLGMNAL